MADSIFIQVDPKHINYINRIMEGYEYLGVVSTVNREKGILRIRATIDTIKDVHLVLSKLPLVFSYVDEEIK